MEPMKTIWGTIPGPPEPFFLCDRCGKQVYEGDSCNYERRNGEWHGVCYACLGDWED